MSDKYKILFVCLGNICRSPAAEGIFRQMVEKRGLGEMLEADSAGTYAGHTGEQPDSRMRNATSNLAFLNAPILAYAAEIRSAVMVVHGEKAHSRYMGEDAFKKLQGDNKRLLIVPGANHTDLYDKMEIIPFDEIAAFYREYLK